MAIHAKLGASNAYRWMACPGSPRMCEGIPNTSSEYAREGTAAHALAELSLEAGLNPSNWLGEKIEGVVVSQDMVGAVNVYYDYIRTLRQPDDEVWIEQRVDLQKLTPPVPMFGTSDCIIYRRIERKLWVLDYKHGAGVAVEAKGNPQGRYYALGAMLNLGKTQPVVEVEIVIVQPRAPHSDGPIRTEIVTPLELIEFGADLIDAARATLEPNAPTVPGDHCGFCSAAGVCPGLRKQALVVAQDEFSEEIVDPRQLSPEQVADLLAKADLVEAWVKSLRAHAFGTLERGGAVPGWKLVPKRPMRKWVDEAQVSQALSKIGLDEEDIYDMKLKTPAQIEKVLSKEERAILKDLTVSVSSGLTMVPESDKRTAAASSAADDFTALP